MMQNDLDGAFPDEQDEIYTVTEITEAIRQSLESEFPSVSVMGEIANFKAHTSGHLYFSLRDEKNLLRVVVFRRYVNNLSFGPENGTLAVASGRLSHYGGSGQTQLLAQRMVPAGRGELELDFRRLLRKLMDEGLTAAERKRPIPPYPERIVVITSPTGAVIKDILDTLNRRWPVAEVIHLCTEVQGPGAGRMIAESFARSNSLEEVDVVILARGGGSTEDLWTFNLEEAARAVAGSVHPVITGIGHEVDTTVVDYVSDMRAATPTAAAELATPMIEDVRAAVDENLNKIKKLYLESSEEKLRFLEYLLRSSAFPALVHRLERAELKMEDLTGRCDGWWTVKKLENYNKIHSRTLVVENELGRSIRACESRLVKILERLSLRSPEKRTSASSESLKRLLHLLRVRSEGSIDIRSQELKGRLRALKGLYPLKVLSRGYTFCTNGDGEEVIGSVNKVAPEGELTVNFYDGRAFCKVERKRRGRPWSGK